MVDNKIFAEINILHEKLLDINSSFCKRVFPDPTEKQQCSELKSNGALSPAERMFRDRLMSFQDIRAAIFTKHFDIENLIQNFQALERNSRKRRDASSIFKMLFNIPSSKDFKSLLNKVKIIWSKTDGLINSTKILTSNQNITFTKLDSHEQEISALKDTTDKVKLELAKIMVRAGNLGIKSTLSRFLLHIDFIISKLQECETVLMGMINKLHSVVTTLQTNRLDPKLITPFEFRKMLAEIHKNNNKFTPYFGDSIWESYKFTKPFIFIHNGTLHTILNVILTDRSPPVIINKLTTVPQRYNDTALMMEFDLKNEFLATSNGLYREMTQVEFNQCSFAHGRFCTALTNFFNPKYMTSCLFVLRQKPLDHTKVKNSCKMKFTNVTFPFIKQLSTDLWYMAVNEPTNIVELCVDSTEQKEIRPPYEILHIKQFCTMLGNKIQIISNPGDLTPFDQKLRDTDLRNPLNSSLLLNPFDLLDDKILAVLQNFSRTQNITRKLKSNSFVLPLNSKNLGKFSFHEEEVPELPDLHFVIMGYLKKIGLILLCLAILVIIVIAVKFCSSWCIRKYRKRKLHVTKKNNTNTVEDTGMELQPVRLSRNRRLIPINLHEDVIAALQEHDVELEFL